ncbi:MAG TPA: glycosyltransferase [Vicinamibacteria bacterium]|nr:glycosyltransferase [Vicinamibacteria bacterium]
MAGHFVLAACRALQERGVETRVLAPHEAGAARRETLEGVPVERFRYLAPASLQRVAYGSGTLANLRASWAARAGLPFLLAAFWARAGALAGRSDVLHAHWIPAGLLALATWGRKPPVVVTVWGSDLALLRLRGAGGLARRLLARAHTVIAVSAAMARELVALGVPADKVAVVVTAIDPPVMPALPPAERRARLGLPAGRPLALFLGRLSPVKGPDVLVEAMRLLRDRQPTAAFVFAGEGNLRPSLEAAVRAHGLADRTVFAGFVPRERVGEYLAACDLLVLPSRSEGLPHAVLEAMACARPVVASAVGGVPEAVEHGVTGALVPPEDPAALAAALEPLLADSGLRAAQGAAGRRLFDARQHTWERVAGDLLAIYERARASRPLRAAAPGRG